jgi:hypothetical protein
MIILNMLILLMWICIFWFHFGKEVFLSVCEKEVKNNGKESGGW